ncbi:hypothetical protein KKG41_05740 [Patescibacteria group bacterium]|nr:hypothetical protein [Patescibacteria group bacterium]MBU1890364.1 hypothetical protein [Patescibacteria group bacterium]
MSKDVSPSEVTITKGQCCKLMDVGADALVKSGLPSKETQDVIEEEGAEIAKVLVADVRRRVEARLRAIEPHVLERLPFDPESFSGKGWEVDERVGNRTGGNLDAGQIVRMDYLREGETYITGDERLHRIKEAPGDIQLDAEDFLALWQEQGHATLRWLYDTKGITWLSFWGTVLRDSGSRGVLCLSRDDGGSWDWDYRWLGNDWVYYYPAGVLASNPRTE